MQNRRARDAHFRRDAGVLLEELEVLQHRVLGKAELAVDAWPAVPGLYALEWEAVIHLVDFHAVEHAKKIEMPPRAAELAVGRDFEPDLLLLFDDLLDLAVFDLLELSRAELALFPFRARFFQRCGAQQAADDVGAKRRLGSGHSAFLLATVRQYQAGTAWFVNSKKRRAHPPDGRLSQSRHDAEANVDDVVSKNGGRRTTREEVVRRFAILHSLFALPPGVAKQRAQNRCVPYSRTDPTSATWKRLALGGQDKRSIDARTAGLERGMLTRLRASAHSSTERSASVE